MEKKYVSVDVETSGPTPGKYSMLSLGACIVGETHIQFYRELKPISQYYIMEAMRVGAKGLECLHYGEDFDTESKNFKPVKVLEVLSRRGEEPIKVMNDFAEWINQNTKGFKPVEAAAPIKFDGMFTAWYFDNFYSKENPLGYSGEDINSMYRGLTKNRNAKIEQLRLRDGELPHNALEDAIIQAKEFERVLELMKYC